jgi:hypothetical protein
VNDEGNDLPEIQTPILTEGWEEDFLVGAEEQFWPEYDEISEAKKQTRLAIHKAFGWIIPIAIILAFVGFAIVLAIYLLHLIIPTNWRWLTQDELSHIHSIVFSGVVGGAAAIFAKTYFLDETRK